MSFGTKFVSTDPLQLNVVYRELAIMKECEFMSYHKGAALDYECIVCICLNCKDILVNSLQLVSAHGMSCIVSTSLHNCLHILIVANVTIFRFTWNCKVLGSTEV